MNNSSERLPLLSGNDRSETPEPFLPRRNSAQLYFSNMARRVRTRANRSDSLASTTSIISTISAISTYVRESPIFNLPKTVKRFVAIVMWALLAIGIFQLVFLPRTSLSRDFRRIHFSIVGRNEVERLFLRSFGGIENSVGDGYSSEDNKILEYLTECHDRTYVFSEENDRLKDYMVDKFKEFGHNVKLKKYWVYMSRFVDNSLILIDKDKTIREIDLTDGQTGSGINSHHTYSTSGEVESQFVYVNYGNIKDYELLESEGVELEGKIHLLRIDGKNIEYPFQLAEAYGASGIITFNHHDDDTSNEDVIENISVKYSNSWPGDPTSLDHTCLRSYWCSRNFNTTGKIPQIPSLSISYSTAKEILNNSNSDVVFDGGLKSRIGLSESKLRLSNQNTQIITPLTNVLFEIPGLLDEVIIVGASRDSLTPNTGNSSTHGGATEASTNALLLSLAEHLGKLSEKGWRPLRTVMIVSWDASKPGLLGSSEYGKDESERLKKKAVAYVNLKGITGTNFEIIGNPLMSDYFASTSAKVLMSDDLDDIDNNLYHYWQKQKHGIDIGLLNENGNYNDDFAWFQYALGIPSCTIGFVNGDDDKKIPHYDNSKYDNIENLKQIDPDLKLHKTLVKYIGMLTLQLSEHETIKFNTKSYYETINTRFNKLTEDLQTKVIQSIKVQLDIFKQKSIQFDIKNRQMQRQMGDAYPWFQAYIKIKYAFMIKIMSGVAKNLDSVFLYPAGLTDRPLLKHTLWAPTNLKGSNTNILPGLESALRSGNSSEISLWLNILHDQLQLANKHLTV